MNRGSMRAGIGPLAILLIVAVVIIIGIGAYAWITISKYVHLGSNQQSFQVLGANQTGTLSAVMQNVTGGFNTSQFQVSYAGNATVVIDSLQLSFPLKLNLSRYYNDTRAGLRVSDVPLIGNLSIVQIRNGSSYYTCSGSLNRSVTTYSCMMQNESNTIFELFNMSSGSSFGSLGNATVHLAQASQGSVDGMPCTNNNGYFNYSNSTGLNSGLSYGQGVLGQQASSANFTFLSCISSDRIPLSLSLHMVARNGNSTTSASLQLVETSFSRSSSASISQLPGPLVNSTR